MEFHPGERVVVNPLRIKNWIISELEASVLLYFGGVSRDSARIIDEQSANVERNEATAIDAMHALKAEAIAMKECLLKGDFERLVDGSVPERLALCCASTPPGSLVTAATGTICSNSAAWSRRE